MVRQTGLPSSARAEGSALVIMLACLVLVTVLTVALLSMAQTERRAASAALSRSKALLLADLGADLAMAKIADAISRGSQANRTWASEPGRIWIFDIAPGSGAVTREFVPLLSAMPGPDDPAVRDRLNVDLNAPSIKGEFPIASPAEGRTAATMKVGWENLLADPSQPASATNQIIGRVAYWVDDESCKVNINTADGSRKGNDGHYGGFPTANPTEGYSFGFGTPSEISLAGLPDLDQQQARAIADTAWDQEFSTAAEIVRAKDPDGAQAVTRADFERIRFDITHHNSSPDLNFMGEPRIHLVRTIQETGVTPRRNAALGPNRPTQAMGGSGLDGLIMDHIYPQPSQLNRPPYLAGNHTFSLGTFSPTGQRFQPDASVGGPARILANYLAGINQRGQPFTWPVLPGSDNSGFRGKYTDRQLDSMVLQMMQIPGHVAFCDEQQPGTSSGHLHALPYMMTAGWLSGQPVMGLGRVHYPTELLFTVNTGLGDPFGSGITHPTVQFQIHVEQHWPKGSAGMPNHTPYEGATSQFSLYGDRNRDTSASPPLASIPGVLNFYDRPAFNRSIPLSDQSADVSGPGLLGSTWMDQMLRATAPDGSSAGIDFYGTPRGKLDTDQLKAEEFHPYTRQPDGKYHGSVASSAGYFLPAYEVNGIVGRPANPATGRLENPRYPGTYISARNRFPNVLRGAKPDLARIRFVGGIHLWIRNHSGTSGYILTQAVPFMSILPEIMNIGTASQSLEWVLPVDFAVNVPGTASYLLRNQDPLVSLFPGDWESIADPSSVEITMRTPSGNPVSYARGGSSIIDPEFAAPSDPKATLENFDGDNPGYRPGGGGDPLSIWMPRLDNRIPRQARFPSIGGLFSMRTGLFPDKALDSAAPQTQRGTPFRGLNFAPSSEPSQSTSGGTSYPDWVLLDFVTVPFLPAKPYGPATSVAGEQPFRRLTHGGATVGRININNPPVPFPFGEDPAINQQPPVRNALQALFFNLKPSNSYDANGDPIYTTIDKGAAKLLADAVAEYQRTNGPFFLQGQIANVPAVAQYLYRFSAQSSGPPRSASISRNDLVRDVVGAITTRSNTFSVWVVAQTIKKRPGNTDYGNFEPGDQITSEVRRRYLVERFIETGQDGVPGNAVTPASPNRPNTFAAPNSQEGDPASPSAPFWHPRLDYPLPYRWRTLQVENIQS